MTFRMQHSISLSCSIETAWHLLSSPDELAPLQELLPSIGTFVLASKGDPTATPSGPSFPSKEGLLDLLASAEIPTEAGIPWPDIDASPEAAHFSFYEGALAFVEGTQIAVPSHDAVLFHSRVTRAGIEEWKLRVLEKLDADQVRVTETVWGKAPFLLAWYLRWSGKATNVHAEHMELYHKLVTNESQ